MAKRALKRTMAGHCRSCGRTLTDADSLSRGYGPECAAKLLRSGAGKGTRAAQATAGYPVERYERIQRGLAQCEAMLETAEREYRLVLLDTFATADELAEAKRIVSLRIHWLTRADAIERQARRLLAPVARVRVA